MSKLEETIRNSTDKLHESIKCILDEAYNDGFNDGLGVTLPTQKEFDEYHREPQGYGEEDEWLVLSYELYDVYTALEMFRKYLIKNGWFSEDDEDGIEVITGTISERWIGYRRGGEDREPVYWLNGRNEQAPTFWKAWVVETQ